MTEENRRSPRYNLSTIEVQLSGQSCEVVDVSPTGVLLKNAAGSLERGDAVTLTISVPLMSHVVPVQIDGFVVANNDRGVAIDYVRPAQTWPHVLRVLNNKEQREQ